MMRNNLPSKFAFSHSGDPSVGINGETVYVEYEGGFADEEYQKEFVEAIREALKNLMDFKVRVTPEHSHTCRYCKKEFVHLDDYCDSVCTERVCRDTDAGREDADMKEQDDLQAALLEDQDLSGNIDADIEYFRDRNQRILAGINGAGVRV